MLIANGVQQMWIQTHGFSQEGTSALRVSTVCYSLGTLLAIISFMVIIVWQKSNDSKSDRPLHIDEKGFVGAKSLVRQPERSLKMVVAASALFMICEFGFRRFDLVEVLSLLRLADLLLISLVPTFQLSTSWP